MSKEKLYIVSLSGGKDSTAMLLRLIEEKRPIDRILFCDTGLEFPQMYDHLNKLEQYIGRKITRLKAEYSLEYYFLEYMPKRKNPGLRQYTGNSWAGPNNRWCTGRLKINVVNKYLKELKKNYDVVEYIGIAADEPKRVKGNSLKNCFPTEIKRCGMACCHRYFVLKKHRKYGIIKAWKNIDGAVGNTNVCRVNNGLQPINKRLKEQLIVTAMKKRRLQRSSFFCILRLL